MIWARRFEVADSNADWMAATVIPGSSIAMVAGYSVIDRGFRERTNKLGGKHRI